MTEFKLNDVVEIDGEYWICAGLPVFEVDQAQLFIRIDDQGKVIRLWVSGDIALTTEPIAQIVRSVNRFV